MTGTSWPWRRAAGLSASVAVAAVPVALIVLLLGSWPTGAMDVLGAVLETAVLVGAVVVTVAVAGAVASRCGIWRPRLTAVLLVAIQAGVTVILTVAAPFRPGLLSVLLYWAPAMVLATGVLRATRAALLAAGGLVVAVVAVAVPVRLVQQAISAEEWIHMNGIPSRAYAQVISVPGSAQNQFQWDSRTGTLSADFVSPGWTDQGWGGTETVTRASNPCQPGLDVPAWTDYFESGPVSCVADGQGLWLLRNGQGLTGYALRAGDLTITVTTDGVDGPSPADVLAHHQATDAELWSLTSPYPRSVAEWILQ